MATELDEVWKTIEANQRAKDSLWKPSPVIEHLLWQVCGAWETVVEQVRGLKYSLKEIPPTKVPFVYPKSDEVAHDMRGIAEDVNLRLPSNAIWTEECERAKTMRDHLGHMLHFKSIDGKAPNQSVTVARVPWHAPDEMSIVGEEERDFEPGEVDMRMKLAKHRRIEVTVTAEDARAVLKDLKYVYDCARALEKFGVQFNTWPDTKSLGEAVKLLPWWMDDWGPKPGEDGWSAPTMRLLRIAPKAEFDASLPESVRPEF